MVHMRIYTYMNPVTYLPNLFIGGGGGGGVSDEKKIAKKNLCPSCERPFCDRIGATKVC